MNHTQTYLPGELDGFFDYDAPGLFSWPLEMIAHHLSNLNRYTGAARRVYSVAEHSWRVALYSADLAKSYGADPLKAARAGLLHDATEAVLGDVNSPLKECAFMEGYRHLEHSLHLSIARIYGLEKIEATYKGVTYDVIRSADLTALEFERVQLLGKPPIPWKTFTVEVNGTSSEALPVAESEAFKGELGMPAEEAKALFLSAAKALGFK